MASFSRTAAARTCSFISAVEKAGLSSLFDGAKVSHDVVPNIR
jgi:hypothetical protein